MLDRVLLDVRAGRGRALVLRGGSVADRAALLDHLAARVPAGRVLRTVGVETASGIASGTAYAALRRFCAPLPGHPDPLPGRPDPLPAAQRSALSAALGGDDGQGEAPRQLLVGLAVLGLLGEAAAAEPLVCIVDEVQRLDRGSVAILAFVARRLDAGSVALVFAVPAAAGPVPPVVGLLAGLPELWVEGPGDQDGRAPPEPAGDS